MKLILGLLLTVLSIAASANDPMMLSKIIAGQTQTLIDELPTGEHLMSFQATYVFQIEAGEVSLPVFIVPAISITNPYKMEDCSSTTQSVACEMATKLAYWYCASLPVKGEFKLHVKIDSSETEIDLPASEDLCR